MSENEPGWDAIAQEFKRLYGAQAPLRFGASSGKSALRSIAVYRSENEKSHWHFVTSGLSTVKSGHGFEMTLRLPRQEENPPNWALNMLANLSQYVSRSGNVFKAGEHIDAQGRIATAEETELRAALFIPDPEAQRLETVSGRVDFVQFIGITLDEMDVARRWNGFGLAGLLKTISPLGVTDLRRLSVLLQPGMLEKVQEGLAVDGSNCNMLYVNVAEAEKNQHQIKVRLGALAVKGLLPIFPYRLPFGRDFSLASPREMISFAPGASCGVTQKDHVTRITLTEKAVTQLLERLKPVASEYRLDDFPNLVIEVQQSIITDSQGKEVGREG